MAVAENVDRTSVMPEQGGDRCGVERLRLRRFLPRRCAVERERMRRGRPADKNALGE